MKRTLFATVALVLAAASLSANTFTVTNTGDSGAGSLRQAILDANASPGLDTIQFNIAGSGVHTIAPLDTMTISDAVVSTGSRRPGRVRTRCSSATTPSTRSRSTGAAFRSANYLFRVLTSGATLRGLLINKTAGTSIFIDFGDDGNKVIGNWIGTDVTGTQYLGTDFSAVRVYGSSNHIGGTIPPTQHRQEQSGGGATLSSRGCESNMVQGNHSGQRRRIGHGATGTCRYGIVMTATAHDDLIGGTTTRARATSSLPRAAAARVGLAQTTTIQGNYIGTDASGTVGFGASSGSSRTTRRTTT